MASQSSRPQVWQRNYFPPHGGGKGGGGGTTYNQASTQIPPEVLARYNAVNARAEEAAKAPFKPYEGEFVAPVNQTQQGGINAITNAGSTVQPYFNAATSAAGNALGAAQPYYGTATNQVAGATTQGAALNQQALGTLNQGLAGAQPYQQGATGFALAGTGQVNPGQLDVNNYMSPYNEAVVQSTLNLVDQQQGRELRDQRDQQIMSGGFGGDGSQIGRAVLQGQQGLARANVASNLYNQNYGQALGAAQQQQGVALGAGQANRAALQTGAGQLAQIGQQGFNQALAGSQGQAAIGQQGYAQGLGAAQANQALGQGLYGMGNNYATTMAGLGTGLQGAQLAQGQAQIGAGTIHQQTQQAQDQAVYNQFLQQQGYPFQVAQFLANIATGTGALSGSTTQGSSTSPQPFFSDERLKEDIRTIGHTKDGLRIVTYRYKGSPHTQIGMLAQDVEKKRPEAVGLAGGYKTVDYDAATRKALGGAVANDNGYAEGGAPGFDPAALAQMLLAHQAMFPGGAHDRVGINTGTGPRGMQLVQMPNRTLNAPKLPDTPRPPEPQLKTALGAVGDLGDVYSKGKGLYSAGKEAYGVARDAWDNVVHGPIDDQIKDWSKYGSTPAGGLGGAAAVSGTEGAAKLAGDAGMDALSDTAAKDVAAAIPADDLIETATSLFARNGGRIKRYASGGAPYGDAEGYLPEELYKPEDPQDLVEKQKGLGASERAFMAPRGGGEGGRGGSSGLGKGIGSILGLVGGSLVGMPGLGSMAGGMLGSMFNKGGRAGYATDGAVEDLPPFELEPDNVIPFRPKTGLAVPPREVVEERPLTPPIITQATPPAGLAPAAASTEQFGPPAPPPPSAAPTGIAAPPTGLAPQTPPPPLPPPQTVRQADNFDAPDNVMNRMWTIESGHKQFKPDGTPVVSSAGALGYTQMQAAGPEAAALAGVPYDKRRLAYDEEYNKLLGTTWARHLQQKYGDPYKAAAAYNAGEGAFGNAMKQAAEKGGNYWDYLPAETQGYLHFVSGGKFGKPGTPGNVDRALSMVRERALPNEAPAAGAPAGQAPSISSLDLSMPPKDNPKGDWLDRNERYVVTGLSFLGNMLASPSHQLTGAIGHGLAAAAPTYAALGYKERGSGQQQQQIQISGQQLDIQQRAQYINLLAQLRTMQAARLARGLPEDPQLAAQISHLAKITVGGASPSGGSAGAPTGLAPQTAPEPTAPPAAPPTPPATTPATPPAASPAAGQPQPVSPELAARFPALRELPPQITSREFKDRIHPEDDPIELYKRANEIADQGSMRGEYERLVSRADAAMQRLRSGYVIGKDMMPVLVPGMAQTQRALEMGKKNIEWAEKEGPAALARRRERQSLDLVRHALEEYQTNALADVSTRVQSLAHAVGIPIPNGAKMNAAMVQEIIKQSAAKAGGADTDMGRQLLRMSSIDPAKEPEANKQILAQSYADINANDARYNYLQPRMSAVPQLDTPLETQQWSQQNTPEKFYNEAYNDIAVRGATPEVSRMREGQTYIIEPGQLPGVTTPTKYRVTRSADGKPQLTKVQ